MSRLLGKDAAKQEAEASAEAVRQAMDAIKATENATVIAKESEGIFDTSVMVPECRPSATIAP